MIVPCGIVSGWRKASPIKAIETKDQQADSTIHFTIDVPVCKYPVMG